MVGAGVGSGLSWEEPSLRKLSPFSGHVITGCSQKPRELARPPLWSGPDFGMSCKGLSAISCHHVPLLTRFASLRDYFPVASGSTLSRLACITGS